MSANLYYQQDGITIIHGDCQYKLLAGIDAIVTDPPYGVSEKTNRKEAGRAKLAECNDFPPVHGDDKPFDPTRWLTYSQVILWGANHYADRLPASPSWLAWDKREGIPSNDNADCELAWTNLGGPARLFHHMWYGMIKASEKSDKRVHPTQKPIALMTWCIEMTKGVILDPFMGGGSTLVAAKRLGREAVGIEIEERYCEVAALRLQQGSLFA